MPRTTSHTLTLVGMTALLALSGTMHFVRPKTFDGIVPDALPGERRTWTLVSGAAELVTAATLAVPQTRRLGGTLAAMLLVAVFPANVTMTQKYLRSSRKSTREKVASVIRLPLQIPLVVAALGIRSRAA